MRHSLILLPIVLAAPLVAQLNQRAVIAGEFVVEPPTLVSLGFEWKISGDDNRDAHVDVTYRQKGQPQWRKALPLMRSQREQIGIAPGPGAAGSEPRFPLFKYTAANMFAGSILNLEPDTEYECRFVLSDPDGVSGIKEKLVTVRTRAEPQPTAGGRVFHVY